MFIWLARITFHTSELACMIISTLCSYAEAALRNGSSEANGSDILQWELDGTQPPMRAPAASLYLVPDVQATVQRNFGQLLAFRYGCLSLDSSARGSGVCKHVKLRMENASSSVQPLQERLLLSSPHTLERRGQYDADPGQC